MAAKMVTQESLSGFKQPKLLSDLVSGNTEFAVDIYTELCKSSDGNVFFSPISISIALAMTYRGAKAKTATEMKETLKLSVLSDEDIHSVYKEMTTYLHTDASSSYILKTLKRLFAGKASSNYILNTANCIFARKDYNFLKEFLDATQKQYKAEAQNLDFVSNAEGSRQVINKWVEEQTANMIKDFLPAGSLNDQTAMVLVNAIYFKGSWKDEFEKRATQPDKFKLGRGEEVDVQMMSRSDKMQYGEDCDLGCKIVELPYVKEELSMFIILPNKEDGLAELGGKITASKIADMTTMMRRIDVDLSLPKFKLEDLFNLNEVLKKLGMKDMFVGGKADFSGMDGTNKLYVSSVVHKSFIDVNEEGTEAAAATAVTMELECYIPNMEFKADHPFFFFIRDNRTKAILFMGHLSSPK